MHPDLHKEYIPVVRSVDLLPMPSVITDKGFRILHANAGFKTLMQTPHNVFTAVAVSELFPGLMHSWHTVGQMQSMLPATIGGLQLEHSGRVFDLYISNIHPDSVKIDNYLICCFDVTDRWRQQQEDAEASAHHKRFLELTTTGVIIHRDGKIVYANGTAEQMVGSAPDGMLHRSIFEFISPESREIVARRVEGIKSSYNPSTPIEQKFLRLDGSAFDVEVFAFPVIYQGLPSIKAFVSDITSRKNAELELIHSRQQYHSLIENMSDIVFQLDTEGKFTFLSAAWETLSGFTIADTIGRSFFDYIQHPFDTEHFRNKVEKLIFAGSKEMRYDLVLTVNNGKPRYVEVNVKTALYDNGRVAHITGVIHDIHSKKLADLEIRRIQRTLKWHQEVLNSLTKEESIIHGDLPSALAKLARVAAETLQVSRINIWRFKDDYQTLQSEVNYNCESDQYEALHSFHVHDYPHYFKTILQDRIIVSEDTISDTRFIEFKEVYVIPENIYSMLDVGITSGDTLWGIICIESRNKHRKWSLEDQSFARNVADFVALAYKSSALQTAQNALLEKEYQYRNLLQQSRDAIIVVDNNDRFIEVNDAACQLTGYTKEELFQMHIIDLLPERYKQYYRNLNLRGNKRQYYFFDRKFVCKDGQERIGEVNAFVEADGRIQAIARDVTERKMQEKALRESETRLELALKGADLGTWDFYIRENRMVHNKQWAEMLGYYFENTIVTEQFYDKFVHPDDRQLAYKAFDDHIEGKKAVYETEIRMLTANGDWKWILDKGKVVEWDKSGNPVRASGIHQDITHIKSYQQQLMHQKAFLQELVDAIPNMIYVKNADEKIIMVNTAFAQLLGTTPATILSAVEHLPERAQHDLVTLTAADAEVFATRKPVIMHEVACEHAITEQTVWLQTIKVPIIDADGYVSEVLSVSADVTELKRKENEVKQLNDQLELKVSERTLALEMANKELETFNYSVSHDLRTPLRSIDIFAYFLEKHYNEVVDNDGKEHIRQLRRSVTKMSNLIDNLLMFSRMSRGDKRVAQVAIKEIVQEVIAEFSAQEKTCSVKFILSELPVVPGDADMLKQAVSNLIGNAIKFTKSIEHPVIEVHAHTDAMQHIISVKDNGVGFSAELKEKLFKPFKRLHSDEQYEGSGVGLAIVERIIRRHNGHVWAESIEGAGATFYFSLPVQAH